MPENPMHRPTLLGLAAVLSLVLSGACAKEATLPDPPAPAHFRVAFDTSTGPVVVAVSRADAPHGADRLYALVQAHFFDGARFFRVVPGFVVQFGLAADPALTKKWNKTIPDDPVKGRNRRGTLVFAATSDPNSRTSQVFINLADNPPLDGMGFTPVGKVETGMQNIDRIYSGDGEGPDQDQIVDHGNTYLTQKFPKLDFIRTARILP